MYPAPFEYSRADNISDAKEMLTRYGEEARPLAGGMSLIPLMKLRMTRPQYVVDIGRLTDLEYILEDNGVLRLGALTRHVEVAESPIIAQRLPILRDAAAVIGDVQVRNWGTIGGAIAHADPAGDWGPVCLALGARILCESSRGQRWLNAEEFFVDAYTTLLRPDELITQVEFPLLGKSSGGSYLKFERRVGDFAIASVALQISLGDQMMCHRVGIGLGAIDFAPVKAEDSKAFLEGKVLTKEVIKESCELVKQAVQPDSSNGTSTEYKRSVIAVLFKQALNIAIQRHNEEATEASHAR